MRNCVSMAFTAESMDSMHLEAAGTSLGNKGGVASPLLSVYLTSKLSWPRVSRHTECRLRDASTHVGRCNGHYPVG